MTEIQKAIEQDEIRKKADQEAQLAYAVLTLASLLH
jgi:hypothetical protein